MCHGPGSRPPPPPIAGGAADGGDLVLRAADGTEFSAYAATPEAPTGIGVAILPDVRGLHEFYKDLARRFAEAGHHTVALDYFGRTAGVGDRGDDFDFAPHVEAMTPEGSAQDVRAAVEHLRSAGAKSVFTVGFCLGGRLSWAQAAEGHGLAGAVGFYGDPAGITDDVIARMEASLLILVAGRDHRPVEAFHDLARRLAAGGVEHEMHVYPDAPHSFFDRAFDQHREACDDAWRRVLDFVEAHRRSR